MQNCRDESWQSMAKYCIEVVPNLLRDNSVDNVLTILSRLVNHLPPNAGNFIKWVIEVRRQEEGGSSPSKEANEMPFLKVILIFHFCCWVSFVPSVQPVNVVCSLAGKDPTANP
jgi:hypothetical protein